MEQERKRCKLWSSFSYFRSGFPFPLKDLAVTAWPVNRWPLLKKERKDTGATFLWVGIYIISLISKEMLDAYAFKGLWMTHQKERKEMVGHSFNLPVAYFVTGFGLHRQEKKRMSGETKGVIGWDLKVWPCGPSKVKEMMVHGHTVNTSKEKGKRRLPCHLGSVIHDLKGFTLPRTNFTAAVRLQENVRRRKFLESWPSHL